MKIRDQIPNAITLLNLISGGAAIIMAISGAILSASWLIILAALLDLLDGLAARLLNAQSEIGKQLDSLADVVSFGMAPAAIIYQLLNESHNLPGFRIGEVEIIPFIALLILVAAAYRLAKFNTDPEQSSEFKGLPSPANGLFMASLPLIMEQVSDAGRWHNIFTNSYFLLSIVFILSLLMVSGFRLLSFKFKDFNWKTNYLRYILVCMAVLLLIFVKFIAIPLVILLYILFSFAFVKKQA
jgi:CDP-diacylglycerol--serine O-phosphatidyltransferase